MKNIASVTGLAACFASGLLFVNSAQADNIAGKGVGILGVKAAVDGTAGTPVFNAGTAANINDGNVNSRVDTWFGGGGANNGPVSYVGVLWPFMRFDKITGLTLELAAFTDGGWFGVKGQGPGPGGTLADTDLIEPTIQVSTNNGVNWTTVAATSDYMSMMTGFGIGGGDNPNPNTVTLNFTLNTPVTGINGIRIIGENGGNAGSDANGFLGVFELAVNADATADTDGDGFPDAMELALGGDPNNPNVYPSKFGLIGTGILGTMPSVDSEPGSETPVFNSGTAASINDGNLSSRVDTYNNGGTDTASFVGIQWEKTLPQPLARLELTMALFLDGGWFGPNNSGPAAGGLLNSNYLSEPVVQITKDGGATWTKAVFKSDYLTALNKHAIGGGTYPNPNPATAVFVLTNSANPKGISGINGVRLVGSEGGGASGGFLGVFELTALVDSSDSDRNGLPDEWERLHFGKIGVDSAADADNDGLTNLEEFKAAADPKVADSDRDGLNDGAEVHTYKSDPTKTDTDNDGLSDADEALKYHSNPLAKDTDGDGFSDLRETSLETDPNDSASFPDNFALLGAGVLGTMPDTASASDMQTPVFNAGVASNINDGDLTTRVDSYNGGSSDTASYVGIIWDHAITNPIVRLDLNLATFFDGGWFGVNAAGPGSGASLVAADHLAEPVVQITKDGGTNWTEVAHTSDYLTALDGHALPAVDFGEPTLATATFLLTTPQTGINGIRIAGAEGGTASGGFLGVFELAARVQAAPVSFKIMNVSRLTQQFQFQFESKAGVAYTVQYKSSLADASWQTLTTVTGDGTTKQVTDSLGSSMRFYRVIHQ